MCFAQREAKFVWRELVEKIIAYYRPLFNLLPLKMFKYWVLNRDPWTEINAAWIQEYLTCRLLVTKLISRDKRISCSNLCWHNNLLLQAYQICQTCFIIIHSDSNRGTESTQLSEVYVTRGECFSKTDLKSLSVKAYHSHKCDHGQRGHIEQHCL